ncbi:methionine-R-sulfoxide reductase [Sphaeroforma arctica JP610]|uniref:Peptide-methionine (R)-S-oxide reductase n=1 Tax=Sphaeroforma arctica JP610 TaxID=667725 RepID=A0A0L0FJ82_9EUKA|nr:methionine-R-sulfoxide reductase [Sphaeroforma arctica JP610]KNC76531.1 methionine-R-sulfoxide reductase [Sphaeroforma arctica JP610]|eukprot:XP_014150433.1 methionine-R-sulfoxide reductase [Sphaeroforma arctica JP610]
MQHLGSFFRQTIKRNFKRIYLPSRAADHTHTQLLAFRLGYKTTSTSHKAQHQHNLYKHTTVTMSFPISKTDAEWKSSLSAQEYDVIRNKGTEAPGTGEYNKLYPKADEGHFACRACKNPIYSATAKFDSGCGWPAFDKCYEGSITTEIDQTMGLKRIEIMCSQCGGHLGHVFEGEKFTDTNERHCVNSVSIKFVKGKPAEEKAEVKVA